MALFTFAKQLYIGGGECIKMVRGWEGVPLKLHEFLVELTNVPQWIEEHKLSSCRRGAMRVMALAKAYFPELKPDLLARGFPQYKADGSQYTSKDIGKIDKETRQPACIIAEKLKIKELHYGFKPDGERRSGFNPGNVTAVRRTQQQSQVTKTAPTANIPSSVTPVVPAPPRPLFEAENDLDFQPLSYLEWNYVITPSADEPAGASGSAEATEAGETENPATDDAGS